MPLAVLAEISQAEILVLGTAAPNAEVSQAEMLALGNYQAQFAEMSQLELAQLYSATNIAEISQLELLVLCRGSADQHRVRAWTFILDGHPFYVLRLGMGGTIVYDQSTQRWSEWRTFQRTYWRAHLGMGWDNDIIAGDASEGLLWNIDPDSAYDNGNVTIERISVGGFPMRLRNALACNAVMLSGSTGASSGLVSIRLRTSDDNGNSWFDHGTITKDLTGQFDAEITWQSLGTIHAPGRIFEIYDTGVVVRLDGLDMW